MNRKATMLLAGLAVIAVGCGEPDAAETTAVLDGDASVDTSDDTSDETSDDRDETERDTPDDADAPGDADAADAGSGEEHAQATAEPVSAPQTTDPVEAEGEFGENLTVTDVRIGAHDGFDRVTFELEGDGTAGWAINYQDGASSQGSGEPIEVPGAAVLSIALHNVSLPPDLDDDIERYDGPDRIDAPDDAHTLVELVEDTVFEGVHTWFLGTRGEAPYRVERFDDPQRVVIDVLHDVADPTDAAGVELAVETACAEIDDGFTATATGVEPGIDYSVMIDPPHSDAAEPGTIGEADEDGALEVPASLPEGSGIEPGEYTLKLSPAVPGESGETLATEQLEIAETC